jgi:hypothetical protein
MSLKQFDAHLADPAPAFRCYACGDRAKKLNLLARVANVVGEPGTEQAIAAVTKAIGSASPALLQFVERHDGVVLYRDSNSYAAGIEFFKAARWNARTKEMRQSLADMGFETDEMPDWIHTAIAFGEIKQSANFFAIQPSGKHAGQIFYCDHDDMGTKPLAKSFEAFLKMIVKDPPCFLEECGCYTLLRRKDGHAVDSEEVRRRLPRLSKRLLHGCALWNAILFPWKKSLGPSGARCCVAATNAESFSTSTSTTR